MKYEVGDLVWFEHQFYNGLIKKGFIVRKLEQDEILAIVGYHDIELLHKFLKEGTYVVQYLGENMSGVVRGGCLNKLEIKNGSR